MTIREALDACREMREQGVMPGLHPLVQLVEALAEQMLSVTRIKVQTPSPEIVETRRALAEGEVFLPRTDMGHDSLAGPVGPGCAWDQKSTKLTPAVRYPDGHVEVIEARFGGGGLSAEQIEVACKNVGLDLTCGACASLFYTGYGGYEHDEGCTTTARGDRDAAAPFKHQGPSAADLVRELGSQDAAAQYCLDNMGRAADAVDEAGLAMYTLVCHIHASIRHCEEGGCDPFLLVQVRDWAQLHKWALAFEERWKAAGKVLPESIPAEPT